MSGMTALPSPATAIGMPVIVVVHYDALPVVATRRGDDAAAARAKLETICHELLSNPVIEDYVLTVENGVGKK